MSEYAKLFRNTGEQYSIFTVKPYDPDNETYFELIKKAREENQKQIIINSELMTDLLYATINSDGVILKISMSDNIDQEINDEIKKLINKIREEKLVFLKLKRQLDWVSESGSIDINSIEIFINRKRYEIFSNGLIIGENILELFNNIIKNVLDEYFTYEQ